MVTTRIDATAMIARAAAAICILRFLACASAALLRSASSCCACATRSASRSCSHARLHTAAFSRLSLYAFSFSNIAAAVS